VGDSAQLTWSTTNADACEASGAWSGAKPVSGEQTDGPISASQTYTLTCTGAGGNAVAFAHVTATGQLSINWNPPDLNTDGSPVSGISGYRIHHGRNSGEYSEVIEVSGDLTSFSTVVEAGTHYVAMTAIDLEGDESALSNEIVKSAQ
jgi:hypothetical protein